jgi:heme iron utilization protein
VEGREVSDPLAPHARGILDHMNRDHAGALVELARHFASVEGDRATMTGVDSHGFDVDVGHGPSTSRVRISFPAPAPTPDAVRRSLIEMLGRARAKSP